MQAEDRMRVAIEHVTPEIDCGRFPIKRVVGEKVVVTADIFSDGHDIISARLLYRMQEDREWKKVPMRPYDNDRWKAEFRVEEIGSYRYLVEAWIDPFKTWQRDLIQKGRAGQSLNTELEIGASYVEEVLERAGGEDREKLLNFAEALKNDSEALPSLALDEEIGEIMAKYQQEVNVSSGKELTVTVDRAKALFSTWYEFFPRSCASETGKHATFSDCERLLPEIAEMGFDIVYLPPIHPIGRTNRKGKNNAAEVRPEDVGSPWAIGSRHGGHKAVDPHLGTSEEFETFVKGAKDWGVEIAMDLAYQCSPDHPYVTAHPEWFKWRPDGTIQYAENPPKKYEDIIPFNFETEAWPALWDELKSIALFWIEKGIRIFRVDNPHTKPFSFWEWLIREIKKDFPEVIFFSEAFTRPKVMYRLAKAGFTQSYTYFTWRNTKRELREYLTELTQTTVREYFRPNFWPNTPDILSEYLQVGGRPAFMIRLVLAATLSSNYGIYGPAYELCVTEALTGKEEYLDSEKYEIKHWDRRQAGNLSEFVARVNQIRRENPALQTTWNVRFYPVENESLLFYGKATDDLSNIILVVVNLDPSHTQSGWVTVPVNELGLEPAQPYLVHDLLSDRKHIWQGEKNFVELNPQGPAKIFQVKKRLRREMDFDYFM